MAGRFPLFTDACVNGHLVDALIQQGWDLVRAIDPYPERTPDPGVFARAAREGRVFVSNDGPIERLARTWLAEGRYFRMVFWPQQDYRRWTIGELVQAFEDLAAEEDPFAYPFRRLRPSAGCGQRRGQRTCRQREVERPGGGSRTCSRAAPTYGTSRQSLATRSSRHRLTLPPWIRERALQQPIAREVLRASLGPGESEAISLALEIRADRLIDDAEAKFGVQGVRHILRRRFLAELPSLGVLEMRKAFEPAALHAFFSAAGRRWVRQAVEGEPGGRRS